MTIEELLKYELQEIQNILDVELSFTDKEPLEDVKQKVLDACDYIDRIYEHMKKEMPRTEVKAMGIPLLSFAAFARGNAKFVRKSLEKAREDLGVISAYGMVLAITLTNLGCSFRDFPIDKQG